MQRAAYYATSAHLQSGGKTPSRQAGGVLARVGVCRFPSDLSASPNPHSAMPLQPTLGRTPSRCCRCLRTTPTLSVLPQWVTKPLSCRHPMSARTCREARSKPLECHSLRSRPALKSGPGREIVSTHECIYSREISAPKHPLTGVCSQRTIPGNY